MPTRLEEVAQAQVAYDLRFAIDTARTYPTRTNIAAALRIVSLYPKAVRSYKVRRKLGQRRLDWLELHGVVLAGDPHEISGKAALKETIEPEVTT